MGDIAVLSRWGEYDSVGSDLSNHVLMNFYNCDWGHET